jgi:hypothetical protein
MLGVGDDSRSQGEQVPAIANGRLPGQELRRRARRTGSLSGGKALAAPEFETMALEVSEMRRGMTDWASSRPSTGPAN